MPKAKKWKITSYLALAILTFALCSIENYPYYLDGPIFGVIAFIRDLPVNNATRSITIDVFSLYILSLAWMWHGSKNIGRRYFLIGLCGCTWVAVGFGLPLFLAIKEYKEH